MAYPTSPLAPYTSDPNYRPLPTDKFNPDGKSLVNPPREGLSPAYDRFPEPIVPSNNGFDFHVYYMPTNKEEFEYARELHERIRREFPEFRIYRFWDHPVGPHPTAMFEVNTFTPHQTGVLFSWLTVHRGPCSVLIHPNTGDEHKDHSELMSWMGRPWPLWDGLLKKIPSGTRGTPAPTANAPANATLTSTASAPAPASST